MSPERANVEIVDDELQSFMVLTYTRCLVEAGHTVMLTASSVEEALQKIPQAIQLGVQVAIIDRRIPDNPNDGETVANALRASIPGIRIFSVCSYGKKPDWADAHMDKAKMDLAGFLEIIKNL